VHKRLCDLHRSRISCVFASASNFISFSCQPHIEEMMVQ